MSLEHKIPTLMTDKEGQHYQVIIDEDDERYFWLSLQLDGREVGYIRCRFTSPEDMLIADFLICDRSIPGRRYLRRILRKLRGQKVYYRNFQRLGLGSQLLDIVIAHAKSIGIRHIGGIITDRDRANNPKLTRFYETHGFQITGMDGSRIDLYLDDK